MPLEYYYALDEKVAPYLELYSLPHILYLIACVVTVFLFIRCRKGIRQHRDTVSKVMLGIILFQQIFLMYGWYLCVTPADELLKQALPLEMCRVSSILTIVFLLNKDKRIMDVIFYFSIFALCSLVYPKNIYHLLHVNGISYMINHLMTVITPLFGAIAYGWKPNWKSFARAGIAFSVYFPVVLIVNHLTGGNYFYQVDRPFWNAMAPWLFSTITYVGTMAGFALVTWLIDRILKAVSKEKATA